MDSKTNKEIISKLIDELNENFFTAKYCEDIDSFLITTFTDYLEEYSFYIDGKNNNEYISQLDVLYCDFDPDQYVWDYAENNGYKWGSLVDMLASAEQIKTNIQKVNNIFMTYFN